MNTYKPTSSNKFLTRFAQLEKSKDVTKELSDKEEFEKGRKEGKLRFALASRYMNLTSRGLNTYSEGELNQVWVRDGDSICRVESDLSWVDELLNNSKEEKNENR